MTMTAKRPRRGLRRAAAALIGAAALSAATMVATAFAQTTDPTRGGFQVDERGVMTLAPVLERVTPAVVNIAVAGRRPNSSAWRNPFFGERSPGFNQRPINAGSGVIVDAENGYILTNHHVVDGAEGVVVTLTDRRRFEARVIGGDAGTDIAVLQIDAEGLTAIEYGDSDDIRVGDFAMAIGNAFGLGQTTTYGIISALGRAGVNREGYEDFIQTDASINPGNSGGALITTDGKLIGVNTAIVAPAGGNVGIGFAVPVNMARSVMDQLLEFGTVNRGRLGVLIQDVTPEVARSLDLTEARGAVIVRVEPGSPAEAQGLQAGDVVLALDGEPVDNSGDLRNGVGLLRIGATVVLDILRDGDVRTVSVTIGEAAGWTSGSRKRRVEPQADAAPEPAPGTGGGATVEGSPFAMGAAFGPLEPGAAGYGVVTGVAVTDVARGSPAAGLGLRRGDVIIQANGRSVESVEALEAALASDPNGIALAIYRNGAQVYLFRR